MNKVTISALATALGLGLVAPAKAEDWTGLHLTFGISATNTQMREEQPFFGLTSREDTTAPYAAIGYDWGQGNLSYGVVADLDLSSIEVDPVTSGKGLFGEMDWFATFRGRVGVPVNDQLRVFASGGLAVMRAGGVSVNLFQGVTDGGKETLTGAAVGLGLEYALSPQGHLSAEYVYADFGQSGTFNEATLLPGTLDPIVQTLRLGYTFRY
jgi:outer membrane immunogenic protein